MHTPPPQPVSRYHSTLRPVQRFACKVCLKCWDMDYVNMLHCLDLPTLVVRRQHLKLMTMYNIINGKTVFPAGIFNLREHTSQRHFSSLYVTRYAKTNHMLKIKIIFFLGISYYMYLYRIYNRCKFEMDILFFD